jgi:hypothetical protein
MKTGFCFKGSIKIFGVGETPVSRKTSSPALQGKEAEAPGTQER